MLTKATQRWEDSQDLHFTNWEGDRLWQMLQAMEGDRREPESVSYANDLEQALTAAITPEQLRVFRYAE
jgi:hypothetical protein